MIQDLQGIDVKALVQRAVEKGLCSPPKPFQETSSNEIYAIRHGIARHRRQGEHPTMKEWRAAEANRLGVGESCISNRLSRGKYRGQISIIRKNPRVVFVIDRRKEVSR